MRKLLLLVFLAPIISFSQIKLDTLNNNIEFIKIENVKKSKSQIKQAVHEWIAIAFKDANEVIKLNTNEKIICKGLFDISVHSGGYDVSYNVYFILETAFKEEKYRLKMHSFELEVMGIRVPAGTYYWGQTYEQYVKGIEKQRDTAGDKFTRKTYEKLLADEKQLRKAYNESNDMINQIRDSIEIEIYATASNLYNYVKESTDDDW